MDVPPERIITQGPYRFTRNPMYLGHLIFMLGLTLTFWSWLALVIFIGRAYWFHRRVLHDEIRLEKIFGAEYAAYRVEVKRWIPGFLQIWETRHVARSLNPTVRSLYGDRWSAQRLRALARMRTLRRPQSMSAV
jgi:uncharacterized membrane protein